MLSLQSLLQPSFLMSCSKTNLWIKLNYVFVLALKNCYRVIDQNRRHDGYKLVFACLGKLLLRE
jgi:hypothetical protein